MPNGCAVALGVALVATVALIGLGLFKGCASLLAIDDDPASSVIFGCEDFVKQQLKSPGSAHFHDAKVEDGPDSDGFYSVSGKVDAENSFGASLRTGWTCSARVTDDGGVEGQAALQE